jgi:hypothetical protein
MSVPSLPEACAAPGPACTARSSCREIKRHVSGVRVRGGHSPARELLKYFAIRLNYWDGRGVLKYDSSAGRVLSLN